MFSDLGERKKGFFSLLVDYPTDKSKNKFIKELTKGYKLTNEEDKLLNLYKFKMKERQEVYKSGNFGDYYAFIKTYLNPKGSLRGYTDIFGTAENSKKIKYWYNNLSVFEKGGKNE